VCCSVLQCVAVCCSMFQGGNAVEEFVAVYCSVLQCVAVYGSVSQCVAVWKCSRGVCCSVLQCVAVCCSVLQCVAVCCSELPCKNAVKECTRLLHYINTPQVYENLVEFLCGKCSCNVVGMNRHIGRHRHWDT